MKAEKRRRNTLDISQLAEHKMLMTAASQVHAAEGSSFKKGADPMAILGAAGSFVKRKTRASHDGVAPRVARSAPTSPEQQKQAGVLSAADKKWKPSPVVV